MSQTGAGQLPIGDDALRPHREAQQAASYLQIKDPMAELQKQNALQCIAWIRMVALTATDPRFPQNYRAEVIQELQQLAGYLGILPENVNV